MFGTSSSDIAVGQNLIFFVMVMTVMPSFSESQTQRLTCLVCTDVTSNHECNLKGKLQTCAFHEGSCFTEVRKHGGVYKIRKGCMQRQSCVMQSRHNSALIAGTKRFSFIRRCNRGMENSICHFCCMHDWCNLAETPTTNGRNQSCTQFFPACRSKWFSGRNGFLPNNGVFLNCHCDNLCTTYNDCCNDYQEVCVGVLPSNLRSLDEFGGATGGEYNKVVPRGGGLPLLRCFVCDKARSNEECNRRGKIVECDANQRSCMTEIRQRGDQSYISKHCEQKQACESLHLSSPSCEKSQFCYSCCGVNYCNVFARPHTRARNISSSCLTGFPGYPQCKRPSLSSCMDLGSTSRCSNTRCNCDKDCSRFNDCCSDYQELCASPEFPNLQWIFQEIERELEAIMTPPLPTRGILEGSRTGGGRSRRQFSVFSILEDFPIQLEATPKLIREMKRETKERVIVYLEERGRRGNMQFHLPITMDNHNLSNSRYKRANAYT